MSNLTKNAFGISRKDNAFGKMPLGKCLPEKNAFGKTLLGKCLQENS